MYAPLSFLSMRQILTNLLPWLAVTRNPLPVEWRTSTALSWYLLDLQYRPVPVEGDIITDADFEISIIGLVHFAFLKSLLSLMLGKLVQTIIN